VEERLEGWYTDPYARHEARWMSAGTPTALVRDGKVEGHDPAPDEPFSVTPVRIGDGATTSGGANFRRADDAERGPAHEPGDAARRAADVFNRRGGPPD
jgi:hypothetical protein